jgi:eukaryotic-like serine/threonine-protein kinase
VKVPGNGTDWERLELLYEGALALPVEERRAYLERQCPDLRLRSELEALLDRAASAGRLFDVLADSLAGLSASDEEGRGREPSTSVAPSESVGTPVPDPLLGHTVGQYRIEERIGGGGMGVVYRARDLRLQRPVALKFLPPHLGRDPRAKERFLVEARAAAALDHPNICTVHEIGEMADGRLFLAMACYEGETLKTRIARGPLPVAEAVSIAAALARGLAAAHAAGIVHRDVKPANVVLPARGGVRLLDFGVAKVVGTSTGSPGLTPGTVAYMSPEQIRGEAVDAETDMWSLGIVLYEMLTGDHPFRGDSDATVMHAILREEPRPPDDLRRGVPSEVAGLALALLSRDPRERSTGFERLREHPAGRIEPAGPAAGGPPPGRLRRGRTLAATGLVLIVTGAWAWFGYGGSKATTVDRPDPRSIAVLPFENRSAEGEDAAFLAEGIYDDVLTQLSRIGSLRLISRASVVGYGDEPASVREIGRKLGVSTILEGGVERSGDRLRIHVQLIDALDERHLWAESYDRELTPAGVFAIRSEIAEHIAAELAAALTPEERERIRAQPTRDLDAYEAYLRGVQILNRYEVGDPAVAVSHLERAIELDPGFAEAHARLAQSHFDLGFKGRIPPEESQALAEAAARRALELDETLGEAHAVLAMVAEERSEQARAEREYRRAIELSPGIAAVHEAYAELLLHLGRAEEALSQSLLARELDPQSSRIAWSLGAAFYLSRDHGRAIEHLLRWTQDLSTISPPIERVLWVLASALTAQGRHEEAIETDARRSGLLGHGAPACLDVCATALARSGRRDEARAALERILAWREARGLTGIWDAPRAAHLARVYAALGDADGAIEWLERDLARHRLRFTYARLDPLFDPVRGDPRFERILQRIP